MEAENLQNHESFLVAFFQWNNYYPKLTQLNQSKVINYNTNHWFKSKLASLNNVFLRKMKVVGKFTVATTKLQK